jgi:hypothetical protein
MQSAKDPRGRRRSQKHAKREREQHQQRLAKTELDRQEAQDDVRREGQIGTRKRKKEERVKVAWRE